MAKNCLWGIVPRDDFARMRIIAEFGNFCDKDEIKTDIIKGAIDSPKVLIVKESFINHLIRMRDEQINFDTYIKLKGFDWRKAGLGGGSNE